jgi:hypothetical protein
MCPSALIFIYQGFSGKIDKVEEGRLSRICRPTPEKRAAFSPDIFCKMQLSLIR